MNEPIQGHVTDIECTYHPGRVRYRMTVDLYLPDGLPRINFSRGITITPNDQSTSAPTTSNQDRKLDL